MTNMLPGLLSISPGAGRAQLAVNLFTSHGRWGAMTMNRSPTTGERDYQLVGGSAAETTRAGFTTSTSR